MAQPAACQVEARRYTSRASGWLGTIAGGCRRNAAPADGRHHAPSRLGLNPRFTGSPLYPAYASSRDEQIAAFGNVPVWVHGHTHSAKTDRIANTVVRSNALGFAAKGGGAPGFSVKAHFDIK